MERPNFVNEEIYHVYNRGVEKRKVFMHEKDYRRFVQNIFEFNDELPVTNLTHLLSKSDFDMGRPRKLLVEALCFCLMPNHYHFMLRQKVDGGITEFMRKIGTGYTNYFNKKYERVGPLFQGKFKAVHVKKDAHLLYLPHYIHLNPLDIEMPEWREQRIRNMRSALKFLESYRWSSYRDYLGKENFPLVTERSFLEDIYRSPTSIYYKQDLEEWLTEFDLAVIRDVILE